jgi:ADP-heptose:LPS heptosyltransferase
VSGALAVHPGALGDVLLAIPALRALRERHSTVRLAAAPRIAQLLSSLGVVDEACAVDRLGLDALFVDGGARASLFGADRVVCWMGAGDAAFTRRLSAQAPSVTVAPSVGEGLVWAHLLRTAVPEGRVLVDPVIVPASLRAAGRELLVQSGWDGERRVLIVHPGAGSVAKRWPAEGFASAAGGMADQPVLVVHRGPADADAAAALARRLTAPLILDEPALPALAGALSHATAFVGNDSGVSHLAAAVGIPAVVPFVHTNLPWQSWSAAASSVTVDATQVRPQDLAAVVAMLAAVFRPAKPLMR